MPREARRPLLMVGGAVAAGVATPFVLPWLLRTRTEDVVAGVLFLTVLVGLVVILAHVRVESSENAEDAGTIRAGESQVEIARRVRAVMGERPPGPNRLECGGMGRCRDGLENDGDAA